MGSPEFALAPLKALLEKEEVLAVVTQPDKPKGRGLKTSPCPVKAFALEKGVPVYTPEKLKGNQGFFQILKELAPDLIVVCAYGKILPKEVLEIPRFGCWNIHASLLPKYRGASPINYAILNGEKETGITIMLMDEGLDTGPILFQKKIPIEPEDTALSLSEKLSKLGAECICETIDLHKIGKIKPLPQDNSQATYAPLIKKEDAFFSFEEPGEVIERKVRAFLPWPVAWTNFQKSPLKVFSAKAFPEKEEFKNFSSSQIIEVFKEGLLVKTGEGAILLKEVQLPGKKRISGYQFACGKRLKKGDLLI